MGIVVNKRGSTKLLVLTAAAALLAACGSGGGQPNDTGSPGTGALRVVASIYPLAFTAQEVGGSAVSVTTLTPAGVEPHDLELATAQVIEIKRADIILTVPGISAVDQAVAQNNPKAALDVTKGVDLLPIPGQAAATADSFDPHIWLDPANLAQLGDNLAQTIGARRPDAGAQSDRRAKEFAKQMSALRGEFLSGTKSCRIRDLVVTHEAFGYMARAFDFTQHGLSGISPDAEPSPARLQQIAQLIKAKGVKTIYFEALVSPKVAETLASETGVGTAVLDPLEGNTGQRGYPALMRENLAALRAGQDCT